MNSLAHMYDDFTAMQGLLSQRGTPPNLEDLHEDQRLEAYEEGYKSGWEDAVTATRTEQTQLSAEFVQQVQDMSFSYHEAHAKLSAVMTRLLTDIVARLLPELMQPALSAQLADQMRTLVEDQPKQAIELAVAPENRPLIEKLLSDHAPVPFAIVEDPGLTMAQVFLRVDQTEREINLDAVTSTITSAVQAFLHLAEQKRHHG